LHNSSRGLNLLVRAGIGLGMLGASIGSFAYLVGTKPAPPLVEETTLTRLVRTIQVEPTNVARSWRAYGTARAMQSADVSAELSATIVERPQRIEPGAAVSKGELIVALDAREFQAMVNRSREAISSLESQIEALGVQAVSLTENIRLADENLRLLRDELEMLEEARKASGASQVEVDRTRRQLTTARQSRQELQERLDLIPPKRGELRARIGVEQANLDLALLNVARTRIVAPFDSVLQSVMVR